VRAKGKLLCKFPKDPMVRGSYFRTLKLYKKQCNRLQQEYRRDLLNKLENLNETNPRAYWELVKKLRDSDNDNSSKIEPSEWLEYFSNLNKKENSRTPACLDNIKQESQRLEKVTNFSELDFHFTKSEILKAINQLKNRKLVVQMVSVMNY